MASSHSPNNRSAASPTTTLKKDKRDESGLFERIGTFGRKKKSNKEGS